MSNAKKDTYEAADVLQVTLETVTRLCRIHGVGVKEGQFWRLTYADIEALRQNIRHQTTGPESPLDGLSDQIKVLIEQGADRSQIAETLGFHYTTVCRWLRRNGITVPRIGAAQRQSDRARELYAQGYSLRQVADRIGISHGSVRNLLDGEAEVHTQKASIVVDELRRMVSQGLTQSEIADRMQVSKTTLKKYLRLHKIERPDRAESLALRDKAATLRSEGRSLRKMSAELGVSVGKVRSLLRSS